MEFVTPKLDHFSSLDYEHFYEPAEDTFLLLDCCEKESETIQNLKPLICLEVGSGSGCVSSFLANILKSNTFFICTDINEQAALATKNTGFANKQHLNSVVTDLVSGLLPRLENAVDLIVFNPPYVVTETEEINRDNKLSLAWAGGVNGREVMDQLFPIIPRLLSPGGIFYLLVIKENKPDEIKDVMFRYGMKTEVLMERRAGSERQMVLKFTRILI